MCFRLASPAGHSFGGGAFDAGDRRKEVDVKSATTAAMFIQI